MEHNSDMIFKCDGKPLRETREVMLTSVSPTPICNDTKNQARYST